MLALSDCHGVLYSDVGIALLKCAPGADCFGSDGAASSAAAGDRVVEDSVPIAGGGCGVREGGVANRKDVPDAGGVPWSRPERTYPDAALSGSVYGAETSTGDNNAM